MTQITRKMAMRDRQESLTHDQEIVLVCAFRYALGRMTYVVASVSSEILKHISVLPAKNLSLFIREVNEAEERDALGMDMDKNEWFKVREACAQELKRRGQV